MSISAAECVGILNRIWDGTASFEERAGLEFFLLEVLRRDGTDGVEALLSGFLRDSLGSVDSSSSDGKLLCTVPRDGEPRLLITAFVDSNIEWVDVSVEAFPRPASEPDPRHTAFYSTWERFLTREPPAEGHENQSERAVFLIGLLESELMNGGLGQYLTNADGAHLTETVARLGEVGATKTRALLLAAARLADEADKFLPR